MASVQFTWSDMWLKWYNLQDANVKDEFLKQIDLRQTVSQAPAKIQVEMLECAPVEVKRMVNDVLRGNARKELFDVEDTSHDVQSMTQELHQIYERIAKHHEGRKPVRKGLATV